jgi:hypothetical protein
LFSERLAKVVVVQNLVQQVVLLFPQRLQQVSADCSKKIKCRLVAGIFFGALVSIFR